MSQNFQEEHEAGSGRAVTDSLQLDHLDEIAREAWMGNYDRAGALSENELFYVALASGRMRELVPRDSIPYAVSRIGRAWMARMFEVWGAVPPIYD